MKKSKSPNEMLQECIKDMSDNSWLFVKTPGRDFSRKGKLPFQEILRLILSMQGKSITHELLEYFNRSSSVASSSAFVQKRNKLLPSTMETLFSLFVTRTEQHKLYKGYRLLAVDGSDFHVPSNKDEPDCFYPGTNGQRPYNLLHLNALYDMQQRIYVDAVVQKKANESGALCTMVDRSAIKDSSIVIADRGYESYNNLAHIIEKGWKFLFRIKDINSSGIASGFNFSDAVFDLPVSLTLSKKQTNEAKLLYKDKDHYRFLPQSATFDYLDLGKDILYSLSFRIVRFPLSDDNYEVIITNLDENEFPPDELKKLYALRWSIETSFRHIKFSLGALFFHSNKVEFISQEIFAALIMYNLTELTISLVVLSQNRKYIYRVTFSNAAYVVRQFFLGRVPPPELEALLSRFISPIRPDRSFSRKVYSQQLRSFIYRIA